MISSLSLLHSIPGLTMPFISLPTSHSFGSYLTLCSYYPWQSLNLDITIVGNKTDTKREVLREDAERISRKLGCRYLETSALTGDGVGELVKTLLGNAIKNDSIRRSGR